MPGNSKPTSLPIFPQPIAARGAGIASDELPSEFGATVEDAERLLRKASRCFVFLKTGLATTDSAMWEVSQSRVRAELKRCTAGTAMPCELMPNVLGGWSLYFSGMNAIEHAAGRAVR